MAAITASTVAELRTKTNTLMMECRKAPTEAEDNLEKAEEILRVKLGNKAGKAASRIAAEDVVAVAVEGMTGALVEVNCETDFILKSDSFLAFANSVAALIAKNNPADVAVVGALPLSQDGFGPTVEGVRVGLIGKISESMTIRRFQHSEGTQLTSYLHGIRIGVTVASEGNEVATKDAAMQAAAMKPVSLSAGDVSAELVAKERSIAEQKIAESSKLAGIVTKMVGGNVQKYLKEASLLDQLFVKNDKQTVEQMLKAANTTMKVFTLYVAGEGIEKKQDDFAAEVATQVAVAKRQA